MHNNLDNNQLVAIMVVMVPMGKIISTSSFSQFIQSTMDGKQKNKIFLKPWKITFFLNVLVQLKFKVAKQITKNFITKEFSTKKKVFNNSIIPFCIL